MKSHSALWSRLRRNVRRLLGFRTAPSYAKVFVIGCPRSGTTWVTQMLASHPMTIGAGESHLFPDVYRRIVEHRGDVSELPEMLLRQCESKSDQKFVGAHQYVAPQRLAEIVEHALRRGRRKGWDRETMAGEVVRVVLDEFFLRRGGSGEDVLVEKTPTHVHYADVMARLFPEARFVHVLRDGRDVCVSLQMRAKKAAWAPPQRREQIAMWTQCVERGLQWAADPRFEGRMMTVRYEDFQQDFADHCRRLYAFCGLPADETLVDRAASKTDFQRIKQRGEGLHNRKGVVGDWREHFTREDIELFEQMAGDTFRRCGYAA